jgi:hypothetical protein
MYNVKNSKKCDKYQGSNIFHKDIAADDYEMIKQGWTRCESLLSVETYFNLDCYSTLWLMLQHSDSEAVLWTVSISYLTLSTSDPDIWYCISETCCYQMECQWRGSELVLL